ncbi:MAG: hypothetical protein J2O49_10270 [Sciscionella sp.]|nr:hypothetical protein [Sciscionella sp.]
MRYVAFLPLTLAASSSIAARCAGQLAATSAASVHAAAVSADCAATDCWTALLADCTGADRYALPEKLRVLSESVGEHAGVGWWFSDGSAHRRRVLDAQLRIEEAARDGDGGEFAEAFACYDQAVATAFVCAPHYVTSVPGARRPIDGAQSRFASPVGSPDSSRVPWHDASGYRLPKTPAPSKDSAPSGGARTSA